MFVLIAVLVIIVCILLILIVLVQNSKGGGLASNFTSSGQVMGVRQTADFLEKATWTLATSLLVLCLLASMTIPRRISDENKSVLDEKVNDVMDPNAMPEYPTSVPETEETP